MKNFNKKIYALNRSMLNNKHIGSIPIEYYKAAHNIANSFSKEYAAIGVMNINDLFQEANYALIKSWSNIDWDYIGTIEDKIERKKAINKYLNISVKGLLNDKIKQNADGMAMPIKGIWNNKDKKRYTTGFGFISVLFPHWFDTNVLAIIEDEIYDYSYEKLGEYLEGWLKKYIPKYYLMMQMFYGLDDIYSKPKKIHEIANYFHMKPESVKKQKQRLLAKLKANEDALKELAFFVATNGIKSQSKVYDYAEINLKIFRD
tara:strand:- start:1594 stop:2373 length:780 start_codon:yes stop_codon:yes gene_type:complete